MATTSITVTATFRMKVHRYDIFTKNSSSWCVLIYGILDILDVILVKGDSESGLDNTFPYSFVPNVVYLPSLSASLFARGHASSRIIPPSF